MTEWQERFAEIGVALAAMSYDDVEPLTAFAEDHDIGYALLSDEGARHVNALGIRNEEYAEGHGAYGIPHPGVFFIDANGVIALKRAVPGYRERPPLDELHGAVRSLVVPEEASTGD